MHITEYELSVAVTWRTGGDQRLDRKGRPWTKPPEGEERTRRHMLVNQVLERTGISRRALADEVEMSHGTINRWVVDRAPVSDYAVPVLERLLKEATQ